MYSSSSILDSVNNLCEENKVMLLYCCESGSRAWGFPSSTSDYDVRFVYTHPVDWYLRLDLEAFSLQINYMKDDLDIVGWDIKKYISLMYKSNPSTIEWAYCPSYYSDVNIFNPRQLVRTYLNSTSLANHYISMATKCYTTYIEGRKEVQYKKYLYLVRSLLCYLYCVDNIGHAPDISFRLLCDKYLPDKVREPVEAIVKVRVNSTEEFVGPCVPLVDSWACSEIIRSRKVISTVPNKDTVSIEYANEEFLRVISTVNQVY